MQLYQKPRAAALWGLIKKMYACKHWQKLQKHTIVANPKLSFTKVCFNLNNANRQKRAKKLNVK